MPVGQAVTCGTLCGTGGETGFTLEKACTAACRLLEQLFYASRCVLMMPLQAPTYVLKGAALPRPLKAMLKKEFP